MYSFGKRLSACSSFEPLMDRPGKMQTAVPDAAQKLGERSLHFWNTAFSQAPFEFVPNASQPRPGVLGSPTAVQNELGVVRSSARVVTAHQCRDISVRFSAMVMKNDGSRVVNARRVSPYNLGYGS